VIIGEIGRLDRIVGNLTDLARRHAVDDFSGDEATPLTPLFEDLQLLVESRARRAGVSIQASAGELTVHASREALAQALLNLLLNALAHAPPRTAVELSAVRASGGVSVRVRDRGNGIPEDQRERIFDPFHSTSGGTGLGLAVVRRLAREHGWSIDIADADADAAGTEFRVLIPDREHQ
jgi:signal transduction histidine kinase